MELRVVARAPSMARARGGHDDTDRVDAAREANHHSWAVQGHRHSGGTGGSSTIVPFPVSRVRVMISHGKRLGVFSLIHHLCLRVM